MEIDITKPTEISVSHEGNALMVDGTIETFWLKTKLTILPGPAGEEFEDFMKRFEACSAGALKMLKDACDTHAQRIGVVAILQDEEPEEFSLIVESLDLELEEVF